MKSQNKNKMKKDRKNQGMSTVPFIRSLLRIPAPFGES